MKSLLFVAALLAGPAVHAAEAAVSYQGVAAAPATAAEKEIAALFDRWNAALATGKTSEVVKLYAANGVLQPTVSNKIRATPEEIADYFDHFLALKPKGTINYRQIRVLDENTAVDSGAYTFDIVKNGKPAKVRARYTYVYEKINGAWKIMNHHSSAMPEATKDN
ncbi:SgcJ/EcaC family oxidoreductase [Duganella sp. Root1480D1]|uniref:SgcJ/EcaC family oxidoreductase n=1 Tax=Duganella sp. Root1480D1 TaxID=1736471 RepID=UPI000709CF19|nr:SgcJ/EcaC family oxidoreductase [Duganella sp. Root1480D1]KQZ30283.1 cag pathogenicity island protein Cag5 [Duganella sp. Root1480D1]